MSFGRVALGLANVVIGFRLLRNGVGYIRNPKGGTQPPKPSQALTGAPLQTQRGRTAVGDMRLRTYRINNLQDRIDHLRQLVEQGKRDPVVYAFARQAVNKKCGNRWCVPEKAAHQELKALFANVRRNVRYTSDIAGIDSYQKPRHTLALKTADCDDYSTLLCASAASLGFPCRFKVIRTKNANEWNHIYAQVGLPRKRPSKWVSLDASVNMPMGWEAPPTLVADSKVFPT